MQIILSIIIVNWDGKRFLDGCLGSIFAQRFSALEVILVDNGSDDGSVDFVRERFPDVMVIENGRNMGFAEANNRGILRSKGVYVLTLNNDTVLKDGFMRDIINEAEASGADVGMWAPKILSFHDHDMIDSVGGLLVYPDGLARGKGRLEKDTGQYDREDVFIPSACAALYRRRMLDEIGLFDGDFFAYCEDTDLGLRARLAGWRAKGVPGAVVYHYYSGTGGRYTPFKAFLVERNRLWVAVKNFPAPFLVLSPFYTLWRYVVQGYGMLTGKGSSGRFAEDFSKSELLRVIFRAYREAWRGLSIMLRKRRAIQRRRKVRDRDIANWFRTFGLSARELGLKD